MSERSTKRRGATPFDGASSDDSRRRKNNGVHDRRKKKNAAAQAPGANDRDTKSTKPHPFGTGTRTGNKNTGFGTTTTKTQGGGSTFGAFSSARQSSVEVTDNDDGNAVADGAVDRMAANSPYAKGIYGQLQKDKIFPPKWPSEPGNPAQPHKAAFAKFREQFKEYRDRARASLMGAGLIDDPDKPKRLEDAIDFKGICEDMCPEFEKITRIFEHDVPHAERDPNTHFPLTNKMVKKLARAAAGQEAPLPMDVRTTAALRRSLEYLMDGLLKEEELLSLHGYLWDRTRAIRRDFVFHSTMTLDEMRDQVHCLETIARFHVTALHTLSKPDIAPEDFSQQQELEQLGKTLLSLMFAYDDGRPQGLVCPNEPEFRAYHLLFNASQPNILDTVPQDPANGRGWKESGEFRTAVSLVEALHNTADLHGLLKSAPNTAASGNYSLYFKLVEDRSVSYTMACFAEIHFGHLRRTILRALRKAYLKSKAPSRDITPAVLNSLLKFDTDQEAVDFAKQHGLSFVPNEDAPLDQSRQYLKFTDQLSLSRLRHAFSRNMVERKRGSHSLPDVIRNTLYEAGASGKEPTSHTVDAAKPGNGSNNLPVSQPLAFGKPSEPKAVNASSAIEHGSNSDTTKSTTGENPFANLSQAATAASANTTTTFKSPFSSGPATSSTDQKNPFSSTPVASESTDPPPSTFSNPFSSAPSAPAPPSASSPFFNPFSQKSATSATSEQGSEPPTGTGPFATASGPGQPGGTSAFSSTPFAQTNGPPASTIPAPSGLSAVKPSIGFGKPSDATPSSANPFAPLSVPSGSSTGLSSQQPLPSLSSAPKQSQTQESILKAPLEAKAAAPAPAPFAFASGANRASSPSVVNASTGTQSLPNAASSTFAFGQTPSITVTPASPAPPSASDVAKEAAKTPSLSTTFKPLLPQESQSQPQSRQEETVALPKPAAPPVAQPPPPKRDLFGDFTRWFVYGDQGLLQEFEIFAVEQIVRETFEQFVEEEAERKRKEEEERDLAEARRFQVYNLRVKYFYRWREIARRLRVKRLRQRDREQYRAALAAMRAKEAAAKKKAKEVEAAKKAALERQEGIDPVEELRELLHMKRDDPSHNHEEALLASGILSGVENERDAVSRIIRDQPPVSAARATTSSPKKNTLNDSRAGGSSRLSQSVQGNSKPGGAKIQALRAQFSGNDPSSQFRRSLPSMSGISSVSPRPSSPSAVPQKKHISRVSDRWRLKAMGLVTMPDGTALPEALANSMRYEGKRYEGWGSFGLDGPTRRQRSRSTSADLGQAAVARARFSQSLNSGGSGGASRGSTPGGRDVNGMSPPTSKRKRPTEEGEEEGVGFVKESTAAKRRAASTDKVERILQEARETLGSLRSSRAELDESTGWFREQSEMMQERMSCRDSSWSAHG